MPDLTLMEKIRKYASITNTINIPREEDKELFDRIMAKDSVFRYDALDLAELRQLANELKNAEIEAILEYINRKVINDIIKEEDRYNEIIAERRKDMADFIIRKKEELMQL